MTVGDLLQSLSQIEDASMPVHVFYHGEVREKSDDVFVGRSSGRADLPKGKRICVITGSCNRSEKTMILSGMAGVEYERSYQPTHWTLHHGKQAAT
jgi:hypothetical protein